MDFRTMDFLTNHASRRLNCSSSYPARLKRRCVSWNCCRRDSFLY